MADGLQNTYFVLRDDGFLVAKLQPGTAAGVQEGQLPSVVVLDDDTVAWPMPVRTQFVSEGSSEPGGKNVTYSLIGLARAELDFTGSLRTARMGETLLLTGGFLGAYDGQGVVEAGFHLFPENASVVVNDAMAGGLMEAGVRQICFVWEWFDAKGQREQSAPSVPISFTCAGGVSGITATIPALRLTAKRAPRTNVALVAYSTEVDGTVFYRTPNGTDSVTEPVYNDPTADTVTFIRKVADTSIIANEILYTAGDILENIAPPASDLIAVSKDRVFVVDAENRSRVWESKRKIIGEAVAFSDFLYFDTSTEGGEITALDVMDDKTVLFKDGRIEVVTGEGPDETGANDSLSPATLVTTDVGCSAPDSVAATPLGLVFQSKKGIYLLSRALQAEYVGAPVEDYNALPIVASVLQSSVNEVRFLTASGPALVWNYFFGQWSVDTHHAAVDAGLHGDLFVFVDASGVVHEETPGAYLDGTQRIPLRIQTGWLKVAGIQGFQRVRSALFLGEWLSAHLMRVKVAYDYKDFTQEYRPWDPADAIVASTFGTGVFGAETPFGGVQDRVYQFKVPLARQKCQAVRFELEDIGSASGASYSLAALALEVGVKPGSFRVGAAKIVS